LPLADAERDRVRTGANGAFRTVGDAEQATGGLGMMTGADGYGTYQNSRDNQVQIPGEGRTARLPSIWAQTSGNNMNPKGRSVGAERG
jgi:hypothetical protein